MTTVKRGDVVTLTGSVNADLTGATVRVIARQGSNPPVTLDHSVTAAATGAFEIRVDGGLPVGRHRIEIEATWPDAGPITFPTRQNGEPQYAVLNVIPDLG